MSLFHQVVDPYELVLIKMPPPPLPTSWGRVVAPYKSGARLASSHARSPALPGTIFPYALCGT